MKIHYTRELIEKCKPIFRQGIRYIFSHSKKSTTLNKHLLKAFQEQLENIPKWNSMIIQKEFARFKINSNCLWLDKLVKAAFFAEFKVAAKNVIIEGDYKLDIPKSQDFIHFCYIEIARILWSKPHICYDGYQNEMRKLYENEIDSIIEDSIIKVIKNMLPLEKLVTDYLKKIEEEVAYNSADDERESLTGSMMDDDSDSNVSDDSQSNDSDDKFEDFENIKRKSTQGGETKNEIQITKWVENLNFDSAKVSATDDEVDKMDRTADVDIGEEAFMNENEMDMTAEQVDSDAEAMYSEGYITDEIVEDNNTVKVVSSEELNSAPEVMGAEEVHMTDEIVEDNTVKVVSSEELNSAPEVMGAEEVHMTDEIVEDNTVKVVSSEELSSAPEVMGAEEVHITDEIVEDNTVKVVSSEELKSAPEVMGAEEVFNIKVITTSPLTKKHEKKQNTKDKIKNILGIEVDVDHLKNNTERLRRKLLRA